MTEARFQAKLLKALRAHPALKDGVVVKLNDRFTKGLPDVMISILGRTTFLELKVGQNMPSKIQHWFLGRLSPSFVVTALKEEVAVREYITDKLFFADFNDAVEEIVRRCINA